MYAALEHIGIRFEAEAVLGNGMGVVDVLVGKIIGELDGAGHWANWKSKKGVSLEECRRQAVEKDARHDKRRAEMGFTVIRDSDSIRLAERIAKELS